MEFERALFRVYERSLESIQLDTPWFGNARPSSILKWTQRILMITASILLVLTVSLHSKFVDQPGCLQEKLRTLHENKLALNQNISSDLLEDDVILRLAISKYAPPDELVPKVEVIGQNISDSTPSHSFDAKYEFSRSIPLMLLEDDMRRKLGVKELNITLEHECFGQTSFTRFLVIATGHDTPVINMLMFSLQSDGFLKNLRTEEEWSWNQAQLPPPQGYSWWMRLARKPMIVFASVAAFFLLSSVTALIVRVLISSGVIFMFPLFHALERCGFRGFDLRILNLSYPWLGFPMQQLRARNKPVSHFITGHLLKVLVYYTMYEASQLAWTQWLYNKSVPAGLQVWLFGTMMLWEYFSMLFLRSLAGCKFFPRLTFIYFMGFHIYFYNFTYGYFDLMAFTNFTLMLHAMLFTIQYLETPSLMRGEVTPDKPRAVYTELPWPQVPAALPPSWSLFVPPGEQTQPIYDQQVPTLAGLPRQQETAPGTEDQETGNAQSPDEESADPQPSSDPRELFHRRTSSQEESAEDIEAGVSPS
mmetsp:Transcript_33906/g.44726  ORF Transcript_33906/g.44726 Transcript_33906/m.44726 type:complete len:533 (-) Transcript_33906:362-1960(-)